MIHLSIINYSIFFLGILSLIMASLAISNSTIINNLTMVIISITKLVIFIFNKLLFYPNKFNHNQQTRN